MPQRLLTEHCAAKIRGVLGCFDRIVLTATLPEICHPQGMTAHLRGKGIRIFDFTQWAEPFNTEIRANAEHQSKYYLTRLGRAAAVAALGLTVFFLIPQLDRPLAARFST